MRPAFFPPWACVNPGQKTQDYDGAPFAMPEAGLPPRESTWDAMNVPIAEIIRRSIRHAEKMASDQDYPWPTMREGLGKILADLEARAPADPSLNELRAYIASGDRSWAARN